MLEIFTSEEHLSKHLNDKTIVNGFLEHIYTYLVKRNYFKLVRQMIDEKVPPLYEPITTPPNAISELLLKMIIQPLNLVQSLNGCSKLIILSFIECVMSIEFSDPIKYFVIPSLAGNPSFPFVFLIKYLAEVVNTIDMEMVDTSSASTTTTQQQQQGKTSTITTSYLLNALLKLDRLHQNALNNVEHLADYIKIIAAMSSTINRLPRRTGPAVFKNDDSSDSDSEDNATHSMDAVSLQEVEILLDVVAMLNEQSRCRLIIENIEEHFLGEPPILHCICKIAHHIMMYHQIGAFDNR